MLGKSVPSSGKNRDAIPESGLLGKAKDPQEASAVRMEREDSARIAWAVDARPGASLLVHLRWSPPSRSPASPLRGSVGR